MAFKLQRCQSLCLLGCHEGYSIERNNAKTKQMEDTFASHEKSVEVTFESGGRTASWESAHTILADKDATTFVNTPPRAYCETASGCEYSIIPDIPRGVCCAGRSLDCSKGSRGYTNGSSVSSKKRGKGRGEAHYAIHCSVGVRGKDGQGAGYARGGELLDAIETFGFPCGDRKAHKGEDGDEGQQTVVSGKIVAQHFTIGEECWAVDDDNWFASYAIDIDEKQSGLGEPDIDLNWEELPIETDISMLALHLDECSSDDKVAVEEGDLEEEVSDEEVWSGLGEVSSRSASSSGLDELVTDEVGLSIVSSLVAKEEGDFEKEISDEEVRSGLGEVSSRVDNLDEVSKDGECAGEGPQPFDCPRDEVGSQDEDSEMLGLDVIVPDKVGLDEVSSLVSEIFRS